MDNSLETRKGGGGTFAEENIEISLNDASNLQSPLSAPRRADPPAQTAGPPDEEKVEIARYLPGTETPRLNLNSSL